MKWRVKEIAEVRGITNARALGRIADIPGKSIYQIWNGTATRVDVVTLEKLCAALRVSVGLLWEEVQDTEPLPEVKRAPSEAAPQVKRSKSSEPRAKAKTRAASLSVG